MGMGVDNHNINQVNNQPGIGEVPEQADQNVNVQPQGVGRLAEQVQTSHSLFASIGRAVYSGLSTVGQFFEAIGTKLYHTFVSTSDTPRSQQGTLQQLTNHDNNFLPNELDELGIGRQNRDLGIGLMRSAALNEFDAQYKQALTDLLVELKSSFGDVLPELKLTDGKLSDADYNAFMKTTLGNGSQLNFFLNKVVGEHEEAVTPAKLYNLAKEVLLKEVQSRAISAQLKDYAKTQNLPFNQKQQNYYIDIIQQGLSVMQQQNSADFKLMGLDEIKNAALAKTFIEMIPKELLNNALGNASLAYSISQFNLSDEVKTGLKASLETVAQAFNSGNKPLDLGAVLRFEINGRSIADTLAQSVRDSASVCDLETLKSKFGELAKSALIKSAVNECVSSYIGQQGIPLHPNMLSEVLSALVPEGSDPYQSFTKFNSSAEISAYLQTGNDEFSGKLRNFTQIRNEKIQGILNKYQNQVNDDLQPVFKNLLGSLKYDDQNIQDSENKIQNFIFNTKTWRNLSPEDNNAGLKSFSNRYKNAVEDYNKILPAYEPDPKAHVHTEFTDNFYNVFLRDVNRMNFKISGVKQNLDNMMAELKKLLPNPLDLQYVTRTLNQGFFANNFAIITNGEINDKPLTDAEKQCGVTAISGQKNLGGMDMMTQLCMPSGQIKPSFDLTFNADHTISVTAKNYNNLSTQDLKRLPFGQIENTYEFKINLSQGAPGAKPSITDFKLSQKIMPSF